MQTFPFLGFCMYVCVCVCTVCMYTTTGKLSRQTLMALARMSIYYNTIIQRIHVYLCMYVQYVCMHVCMYACIPTLSV